MAALRQQSTGNNHSALVMI